MESIRFQLRTKGASICQNWLANPYRRNENFTINQNYPARSVKSCEIVCRKEMDFQQKPLEKSRFIAKMSGSAMMRPASSEKWKAPLVYLQKKLGVSKSMYFWPNKNNNIIIIVWI